jgi:hypothetical protein
MTTGFENVIYPSTIVIIFSDHVSDRAAELTRPEGWWV